ncbi:putative protein T-ENOL isoform X6 [Rousettus aegyptiacus]|uniref:putative protein T-ENOL isoform X6 n=1 Tax=Rousettus aegyptiacus TaxID=9407 RepID=UPI00168D39FF|nr:putative protein T-ENOL isoform X6 [Rousettus aegyptiacus]
MNISTFLFAEGVTFWKQREMECPTTRNEEKKCSRLSQATTSFGGGSKASLSRSEEFLTRISTELTNEALFIAGYHMNPVPTKEKQTQDRGTQISKHVFFTKTRGTDTRVISPPLSLLPSLALTETVPIPKHTSCHPLVTRVHNLVWHQSS